MNRSTNLGSKLTSIVLLIGVMELIGAPAFATTATGTQNPGRAVRHDFPTAGHCIAQGESEGAGRRRTPGSASTTAAVSRTNAGNDGIMMRQKLASSTDAGM